MWTDRRFLDSSLWYECFYRSCYNHFPEFLCSSVGCVSSGLIPGSEMAGFGENARSSVSCDQNSFRGRVVPLCTPVSSVWKWLIWGDGVAGQHRDSFCDALMGIPPPTGWVGQGDVRIVVPHAMAGSRVLQDLYQAKEDPLITEGSKEGLEKKKKKRRFGISRGVSGMARTAGWPSESLEQRPFTMSYSSV